MDINNIVLERTLIIATLLVVFSCVIVSSALASTEDYIIPQWIKNTAKWWSEGEVSDTNFLQGLQWLIVNDLIISPNDTEDAEESKSQIPSWIKKVASFWTEYKITDREFLDGMQFLIKIRVIQVGLDFEAGIQDDFKEMEYEGYSPLFRMFAYKKDFKIVDGEQVPRDTQIELKPDLMDTYSEIGLIDEKQKAVVVIPIFTSSAYWEPGFYTYYRGECDSSCLTTKIEYIKPLGYSANEKSVKVLHQLGYQTITDIDVDKNPAILKNYDKVIILHNEYVTQKEFDAIASHPHVMYLHPNALYAKISVNYDNDTITLIRGHNYPEKEIRNGFDWEFDNSEYEYRDCEEWEFYEIDNGMMLNCYPENKIAVDELMLKMIKEF